MLDIEFSLFYELFGCMHACILHVLCVRLTKVKISVVRRSDKTCEMHACMQPNFLNKTWEIQTFSIHVF